MARNDDQINIRISADAYAALAAAAFVRGLKSPSELARDHVEELAQELANERPVALAMEARAMHDAVADGRLAHLPLPDARESSGSVK